MSLNHAQKEAVAHYQGPCMVLAGPGSGKTLTIAKRIEYLIKEYKVRPEEILVITFYKICGGRDAAAVLSCHGKSTASGNLWYLSRDLLWDFKMGLPDRSG
ncbi:MAG: UvrD-helicase domain-containing protein [Christensenellales bacterium]